MLADVIFSPSLFHLSFVFFFSSRLSIVPHARWKLPPQAQGCRELIGAGLVYRLYSLLSFLKIFELITSERLRICSYVYRKQKCQSTIGLCLLVR